ncbi:MAG: molybdopterin dinucleotide-binding protein [Candidatus Bathyarchaeota archaeon]|nr:MAG: molybdopterin dinucleotide-binding protein [Candidatus Bathyarchaeota archaeon]
MKRFILVTGRSTAQGKMKEKGKQTKEYIESVTICEFDPQDLENLGVKPGENIKISTAHGSVILKASESKQAPHEGIIFIPYGAWANLLTGSETDGSGMPSYKGIPSEVKPALDQEISELPNL